jgi:hypothetical protein
MPSWNRAKTYDSHDKKAKRTSDGDSYKQAVTCYNKKITKAKGLHRWD